MPPPLSPSPFLYSTGHKSKPEGNKSKQEGNMQEHKSGMYWRVWDPLPTEEHLDKKKCSTSLSVPCPPSVELGVLSEVAFLHLPIPMLLESLVTPLSTWCLQQENG